MDIRIGILLAVVYIDLWRDNVGRISESAGVLCVRLHSGMRQRQGSVLRTAESSEATNQNAQQGTYGSCFDATLACG